MGARQLRGGETHDGPDLHSPGRGESLLLLHGIGSHCSVWAPVLDRLARDCAVSLGASYQLAQTLGPVGPRLVETRVGRAPLLGQVVAHPWRVPANASVVTMHAIVTTPGFRTYFPRTVPEQFTGGRDIAALVTVAWGGSDRLLLPKSARRREELPPGTRWLVLPGRGHLPVYDDPGLVARVILTGSDRGGTGDGHRVAR